jgi:hypothetical protein
VIFHVAHRATLALLGWESIDAEKAEQLKSTIRDQTRTLLEQWSRERDAERTPAVQATGRGKSRKQP